MQKQTCWDLLIVLILIKYISDINCNLRNVILIKIRMIDVQQICCNNH
jgi:hypothetical protein